MEKSTSASRLYVTRDAPGDSYKSKSNKELSDAATNGVLFTPPFIDYTALTYIFATQTILVNAAIIPSIIAGMNLLENASFNVDSISLGVGFGLAMSIFGLGADQLNGDFFRKVSRDTKIYVLRLLGRSTKANVAFAVSAIISLNAGVAEELFFRGLIQQSIVNYTGDTLIALLSASALFGFAHYPIFGASALLEAFLGGIFGVVYNISGGNLIAPILAHFIYDFITLFFTWNNVSTDLQKTLKEMDARGLEMLEADPTSTYLKAIFDLVDVNSDGFIGAEELVLSLKLLGYGNNKPFGLKDDLNSKKVFDKFDRNKDGKISFEEFGKAMIESKKELNQRINAVKS